MQYLQSVAINSPIFQSAVLYSSVYVSATVTYKSGVTIPNSWPYWSCVMFDDDTTPVYIGKRFGSSSRYQIAIAYIGSTEYTQAKVRMWEEDPTVNPDAEYIDSPYSSVGNIFRVSDGPTFKTILTLKEDELNRNYLEITDSLAISDYNINSVKIYDYENNLELYTDSNPTLAEGNVIYMDSIANPNLDYTLKTIICELTLTHKTTSVQTISRNVCTMFPRFYGTTKSELTSFAGIVTSKGNTSTKFPFLYRIGDNYINGEYYKSSFDPLIHTETLPNTSIDSQKSYLNVEYRNVRTDNQLNGNLSLNINNSSIIGTESSYVNGYFSSYDSSVDIAHGDSILATTTFGDGTNIETPKTLSAVECVYTSKSLTSKGLKSLPPVDFDAPFYEFQLFDDNTEDEFVFYGRINGNNQVLYSDEKTVTRYPVDISGLDLNYFKFYINSPSVWYPNLDKIDVFYDPTQMSSVYISPLLKTGYESVEIVKDNDQIAGQPYTVGAQLNNFVPTNVGTQVYTWKKNGVVIPNKVSRHLTFDSLSADDNGEYTVEYTVYPQGPIAPDSSLSAISAPFTINVQSLNELTMTVESSASNIVEGTPLTLSGVITIPTNTIISSVLRFNGIAIHTFENNDLAPSYTIDLPTADDAGVYAFRVEYMDGSAKRVYTSELLNINADSTTPIDFTVDFSVSPVDVGERAVLIGSVNSSVPGVSYVYQWHKEFTGAIVGANSIDYEIPATTVDDDGDYWLSVLATAPDYATTVKASTRKELIVRRDPQLRVTIVADKAIVADGKPVVIDLNYGATEQVSPTWKWYANGEEIPGTENSTQLTHSSYGDTIYYAIATIPDEHFVQKNTQSNILLVKGVVAVEDLTLAIDGPTQAGLGERVTFNAVISDPNPIDGSNPVDPDNYSYVWYRNGVEIGGSKEIRVYAAADAFGTYQYKIISKVDPSISRMSPTILLKLQEETTVSVELPASKLVMVGDPIIINSTISPRGTTETFQWYKNGTLISGETSDTLFIDSAALTDSGSYTLSVVIDDSPAVSAPCVVAVRNEPIPPTVDPNNPLNVTQYIHDLFPGRDAGFMWMGWWVLDEIQTAKNEGFDWINDPLNPRFKYGNVLKTLTDHQGVWAEIEIQESRNGYILLLSDLI